MGVRLRPYDESDVGALVRAARESVGDMWRWMPWCHGGYGADEAAAWIRSSREAHEARQYFNFAILDDGRFAGGCGLNHIDGLNGIANIGYWVRSSFTGRGIAPAAVRKLVDWTFANTRLNRLEIVAALDNVRSQRVAEKAGAERDAVLKKRTVVAGAPVDAVLYSIVRPD
jgi:RimJ/RimL family protein N-acetyltransferase